MKNLFYRGAQYFGAFLLIWPFVPVFLGLLLNCYLFLFGSVMLDPQGFCSLTPQAFFYDHSYWTLRCFSSQEITLEKKISFSHWPAIFKAQWSTFNGENIAGHVDVFGSLHVIVQEPAVKSSVVYHPFSQSLHADIEGSFELHSGWKIEDGLIHWHRGPFWYKDPVGSISFAIKKLSHHSSKKEVHNFNGDLIALHGLARSSLLIDWQASSITQTDHVVKDWSFEASIFSAQHRRLSSLLSLCYDSLALSNLPENLNPVSSLERFDTFIDLLDAEWISAEIQDDQASLSLRVNAGGRDFYLDGYGPASGLKTLIQDWLPQSLGEILLQNLPSSSEKIVLSSVNLEEVSYALASQENDAITP